VAINLGRAVLFLTGDDSKLKGDLGRSEGMIQGMLGRAGGFLNQAFSFAVGGLINQGINAIGGSIGGLVSSMVSGNAEFETYTTQFGILLGGADKAKERLAALADFGAKTPFELPEVVRADKILTSFGLDSETTAKRFGVSAEQIRTTIGDVASGTGAGFEEIANLMGRFASGATGEAISRFQELGITTREEMAGWGLQFSKSGELLTPAKEAFTILEAHVRGKFGGMMDAQSKTFSGMVSNLEDWKGQTLRTIGAPIFEVLKDKLSSLLTFLGSPSVKSAIDGFANGLAQGIGWAIDGLGRAVAFVSPYITELIGLVQGLGADLGGGDIGVLLDDIGESIAQAFGSEAGAAVKNVLGTLVDFGGVVQDVIVNVVLPAFQIIWASAQEIWPGIQSVIGAALGGAWDIISQIVGQIMAFWTENGVAILATFRNTWNNLADIVQQVLPAIQSIIQTVFGAVSGFLEANGTDIQNFLTSAWQQISVIIALAVEVIRSTIIPIFTAIAAYLQAHSEDIQATLSGAWEIIKGVIQTALDLIKGILTVALALLRGDWAGAWEAIKATAVKVWDDLKALIQGTLDTIVGILKTINLYDVGKSMLEGLINGAESMAQRLIDAVLGPINSAIAAAKRLLGIHSPSTVFAAMGVQSMTGFAQGVGQSAGLVGRAVGGALNPQGFGALVPALAGAGGGNTYQIDARGSTLSEDQIREQFERALAAVGGRADLRRRIGA
jgi:phage-related protein